MECLFLLAFAIAYIAARRLGIDTFWIIGFVLALKFIVEGILRNSARRATDTAGV
jgi:nitroreductase